MNKEEFEEYLKKRYYDQIKWYDDQARFNKKVYKGLQMTVIVLSALTPILIGIPSLPFIDQRSLAIVISLMVAIFTSTLTTFKYHENWINYRTTCETLKKEIHYYQAKIHEYANSRDPEALFVERVERLISRENTLWLISEKIEGKPKERVT